MTQYTYDDMGQLTREDNPYLNKTYVYTYDRAGNRTSKKTYAYTTGTLGTATATQTLTYSTGAWGDQLAGTTYDAVGNPLTYNGFTMTWSGRQLKSMVKNGGQYSYSFTYNDDGIRTSKTSQGVKHTYILEGSRIVGEQFGVHLLLYLYDESGAPIGLQYRSTSYEVGKFDTYYFEKNVFGDIIGIYTSAGLKIGTYKYDAWGNCTRTAASGTTALQKQIFNTYNPFRYRGYYYDVETALYYLQSRYYDPATGRFINADGYINANSDLLSYNLYAYCSNNPISRIDSSGQFWIAALVVTAVVAFCTVALSSCSAQPTSDVGAAEPYVDLPGSNDPTSPNCYAYAIGSPVNEQPGGTSGRIPTNWSDVNDVGKSVEADLKTKGYTVREISGPDAKVYDNEFKIALRVGTRPYGYNPYTNEFLYDYHFMRQTNTGQWAEKHGYGGASVLWDAGMTPDTIPWTLGGIPYYDSAIIYYAVGK